MTEAAMTPRPARRVRRPARTSPLSIAAAAGRRLDALRWSHRTADHAASIAARLAEAVADPLALRAA